MCRAMRFSAWPRLTPWCSLQTIQDAMDKAKKAQTKLDDVGREIANIRADQTVDDGRILSLNGKADEQSSTNDKNWKDILDMIQEEGDLFSKISKKLKDEELRKVCACTHMSMHEPC